MIEARASKSFATTTNRDADGAVVPGSAGAPLAVSRASRDTFQRRRKLPGSRTSSEVSGEAPKTAGGAPALPSKISLLTWLNLRCLDAPIVAVSWLWLFARSFGISISRGDAWALFLTAWLIYLIDRFGDSLSIRDGTPTSLRQRFAAQHRFAWIAMLAVIAASDLVLIATMIEPRTLRVGAVVGACALAYLVLNRTAPMLWRLVPVKEITIGFLFAAGVMVPLVGKPPILLLSPGWLLFACLCSLNCISIAVWERKLDEAQERISLATAFPVAGRYLLFALVFLAVTSVVLGFAARGERSVFLCVGVSAALLAGVYFFSDEVHTDIRTALADLILLTPIFARLI